MIVSITKFWSLELEHILQVPLDFRIDRILLKSHTMKFLLLHMLKLVGLNWQPSGLPSNSKMETNASTLSSIYFVFTESLMLQQNSQTTFTAIEFVNCDWRTIKMMQVVVSIWKWYCTNYDMFPFKKILIIICYLNNCKICCVCSIVVLLIVAPTFFAIQGFVGPSRGNWTIRQNLAVLALQMLQLSIKSIKQCWRGRQL